MKIKSILTREQFPTKGKSFTMPSKTIPDQTMSMREILDRYARGMPLDAKTPIWDENPDIDNFMPDPRTMDLVDRQNMALQAKAEIAEIRKNSKKPKEQPKTVLQSTETLEISPESQKPAETAE